MNEYKDKVSNYERKYLFSVPLLFLIGFGVFLLEFVLGLDKEFSIDEYSGTFVNILGAVITGYALTVECTIIHYMLNQIRKYEGLTKAIYIVLFVPSLFAGVLIAAIMTIPYYYMCSQKLRRIKLDDYGIFLKWQKTVLIVLGIADLIILIAYFFLV